jgi:hypothetical protein
VLAAGRDGEEGAGRELGGRTGKDRMRGNNKEGFEPQTSR